MPAADGCRHLSPGVPMTPREEAAIVREALERAGEKTGYTVPVIGTGTFGEARPDPLGEHTPFTEYREAEALAALDRLTARLEEAELRDRMRDDGEQHLLGEIEARDARIKELEAALRQGQDVFDNRSHKKWALRVEALWRGTPGRPTNDAA